MGRHSDDNLPPGDRLIRRRSPAIAQQTMEAVVGQSRPNLRTTAAPPAFRNSIIAR